MVSHEAPETIVRDALLGADAGPLVDLVDHASTWAGMLQLRKQLSGLHIDSEHYDLVFQWLWHDDDKIGHSVRVIVILSGDMSLKVAVFRRLDGVEPERIPFQISYNLSEREFLVELPGVPGWGISHHGKDHPIIDEALHTLERLYAQMHQGERTGVLLKLTACVIILREPVEPNLRGFSKRPCIFRLPFAPTPSTA